MEDLIKVLKTCTVGEVLKLSCYGDYLADKLKYLDELNKNDTLRSMLIKIKILKYDANFATHFKWLKYFPNIIQLNCNFNRLDSFSLKSLVYAPKLQILLISNNYIDDLANLKFAPNLRKLFCSNNLITTLLTINSDLPNLKEINCRHNKIVSIDVSSLILLIFLDCAFNCITELVIDRVLELRILNCNNNLLTNLDLSNNKKLKCLNCEFNILTDLNLQKNLRDLCCNHNKLATLNVHECKQLRTLSCKYNNITKLDLCGLKYLKYIDCAKNLLFDISNLKSLKLTKFYCNINQLTFLDLSNCPHIRLLNCEHNNITNIADILKICRSLNLKYSRYDKILPYSIYHGLDKCYICIDTLESIDKIITNCGHIFHKKCLYTWINKCGLTPNCPYCRQTLT